MAESALVRALLLRGSALGARLFRNNVGALQDSRGGWVTYGLCKGSPDLVGWRSVTVTPDMVGTRLAVFVGVEAKTDRGWLSEEQRAFLGALEAAGGIAVVARSTEDLAEALRK